MGPLDVSVRCHLHALAAVSVPLTVAPPPHSSHSILVFTCKMGQGDVVDDLKQPNCKSSPQFREPWQFQEIRLDYVVTRIAVHKPIVSQQTWVAVSEPIKTHLEPWRDFVQMGNDPEQCWYCVSVLQKVSEGQGHCVHIYCW